MTCKLCSRAVSTCGAGRFAPEGHFCRYAFQPRACRMYRWGTAGPDSELLGALCSKAVRACSTKDLVAYKGMQPTAKQYRSERPPEGANDGPEFTAVAETLNTVVTEIGTDTLL